MHEVLNEQIPDDDGEKADHDFDLIRHDDKCDYSDSDKGIKIDVDKIIGSTQGEVRTFQGPNQQDLFYNSFISFRL